MPTTTLYNSLSSKIEPFEPLRAGHVGLYTCGPTVYNYAHIGNLRTYIFENILKRVLQYNNYQVNHVMNITDVGHLVSDADDGEDKIEKGATREGKSAWEIAKFYTKAFKTDLVELQIQPPNIWCKATDHIPEQIALVQKLENNGFTYRTSDGIYFDTTKLPDYGKLANLKNQTLKAGARVELGEKKNPHDFALWKLSVPTPRDTHPETATAGEGSLNQKKRQMEWPSPWGVGFPGWHLECSAMATKYLGQPFDIHCGGIDHIPVHHTNEIAQSEAAEGKPLANYWLHGEFLVIPSGDKMAKSGENFITLQTLKDKGISPLAYRYLCLQTHYRKQMTFSWGALQAAQNGLNNLYEEALALKKRGWEEIPGFPGTRIIDGVAYEHSPTILTDGADEANKKVKEEFKKEINNDLNTPAALSILWKIFNGMTQKGYSQILYNTILDFDRVLGLQIKENIERLEYEIQSKKEQPLNAKVKPLITARDAARAAKNWAESDRLRGEIEALGYRVEDGPEGTKVALL